MDRRQSNPVFNDRKLKLGTFQTNLEKGDFAAAGNVVNAMAAEINARSYTPEQIKAMAEVFVAAWGGNTLVGTKEQIVDGLARIASWGLDGLLLAFPRYEEGMREFRDVTYPLVKQAGLRDNKT